MRTIVKGKNYEVPDRVREYAERKLRRLERLLDDRSDVTVELSLEQHRSDQDSHIVDVTLVIDGQALRSSSAAPTHQAGIDDVIDKIERRTVSHRETSRVRKSSQTVRGAGAPEAERGPEAGAPEGAGRIVKLKRFAIEPMFEEDAVARMEELGHSFFVFVNAENERVSILYRRREGDYGLIEPVVGGDYTKGGPIRRSGTH
ncbi:MAG TPA: ribosome-associated translation inhibitor RaiA [Patescibacteria group bacterium]|nr:ribosome-associated translation inhibitor RaiA [Patescibacteria group bacterium]